MMASPNSARRQFSWYSKFCIIHVFTILSFYTHARSINRRSPTEVLADILHEAETLGSHPSSLQAPSTILHIDDIRPVSETSVSEQDQQVAESPVKLLRLQTYFVDRAVIEAWGRNNQELEKKGLSGSVLLEAAYFLGLMREEFPFWDKDAAERLRNLQKDISKVRSGWDYILESLETKPVVPLEWLSRRQQIYEVITERLLSEEALPRWWENGRISTSLDWVEECELIFGRGDALALYSDVIPDHSKAIDSLIDLSREYFWHRTGEISYRQSYRNVPLLEFEYYDSLGQEISWPRINLLLGSAATLTKPVRQQMKESSRGVTWATKELFLDWYLQHLNPLLMTDFGSLIEEAAEVDPEFLALRDSQLAQGQVDPIIPSPAIKLKKVNLDRAARQIPAYADDKLQPDEIKRMRSWFERALKVKEEVGTEGEADVPKSTSWEIAPPDPDEHINSIKSNVVQPQTSSATIHPSTQENSFQIISNPSTSPRARLLHYINSSFLMFVVAQNQNHWAGIGLDWKWATRAAEFLGLSGHFPPLTVETVRKSNELETALSAVKWSSVIDMLKRWITSEVLNLGYERYKFVMVRLQRDPSTYWWEQGKLETSLHPLLDLKERLIWGDQLSLWVPDMDFTNLVDRAQRVKNLHSVFMSYASKFISTGESGQNRILHIAPVEFSFTLPSKKEIAVRRWRTLLGAEKEVLVPINSYSKAQEDGKLRWTSNLALHWHTARFNSHIIGPLGISLDRPGQLGNLQIENTANNVIIKEVVDDTPPDRILGLKTFRDITESPTLPAPTGRGKVHDLVRYFSEKRKGKVGQAGGTRSIEPANTQPIAPSLLDILSDEKKIKSTFSTKSAIISGSEIPVSQSPTPVSRDLVTESLGEPFSVQAHVTPPPKSPHDLEEAENRANWRKNFQPVVAQLIKKFTDEANARKSPSLRVNANQAEPDMTASLPEAPHFVLTTPFQNEKEPSPVLPSAPPTDLTASQNPVKLRSPPSKISDVENPDSHSLPSSNEESLPVAKTEDPSQDLLEGQRSVSASLLDNHSSIDDEREKPTERLDPPSQHPREADKPNPLISDVAPVDASLSLNGPLDIGSTDKHSTEDEVPVTRDSEIISHADPPPQHPREADKPNPLISDVAPVDASLSLNGPLDIGSTDKHSTEDEVPVTRDSEIISQANQKIPKAVSVIRNPDSSELFSPEDKPTITSIVPSAYQSQLDEEKKNQKWREDFQRVILQLKSNWSNKSPSHAEIDEPKILPQIEVLYPDPPADQNEPTVLQRILEHLSNALKKKDTTNHLEGLNPARSKNSELVDGIHPHSKTIGASSKEPSAPASSRVFGSALRRWWSNLMNWFASFLHKPKRAGYYAAKQAQPVSN